jgi:hypothetical protein
MTRGRNVRAFIGVPQISNDLPAPVDALPSLHR